MYCRWTEAVLAIVIIVFTWWPTQILSAMVSKWIVIVAAAYLLLHAFTCKHCKGIMMGMKSKPASRTTRVRSKRSRRRRR
ncbi:MAG: hypothetical protein ABIH49_03540 [archaeon]